MLFYRHCKEPVFLMQRATAALEFHVEHLWYRQTCAIWISLCHGMLAMSGIDPPPRENLYVRLIKKCYSSIHGLAILSCFCTKINYKDNKLCQTIYFIIMTGAFQTLCQNKMKVYDVGILVAARKTLLK